MSDPTPTPGREPVLAAAKQAGAIAGLVGSIATALGGYGAATGQTWALASCAIVTAIAGGLATVLPTVTAGGARAQVTPLSDPRSMDGRPLAAIGRHEAPPAPASAPVTVPAEGEVP